MATYSADPYALRQLADHLIGRCDDLSAPAVGVGLAAAHGYHDAAAEVAGAVGAIDTWGRGWAAGLRRRADDLDGYQQLSGPVATLNTPEVLARLNHTGPAALVAPSHLVVTAMAARAIPGISWSAFLARSTKADLERLAAAAPELVAAEAGVPPEVRFAANRVLIERERDRIQRELGGPEPGTEPAFWDNGGSTGQLPPWRVDVLQGDLETLDELLEPGRNFLHFDWAGDGRISEWIGPLDAANLVVLVPGVGSDKHTIGSGSVTTWANRIVRHDPSGGGLAVITALEYDAPDVLPDGVRSGAGKAGGEPLAGLIGSLPQDRAIRIVGHSYGSIVAARSLSLLARAADDFVPLGSPGTTYDHADELPLSPDGRVWAGLTEGDPIGHVPFHGPQPASDGFGALVFDTAVEPGADGSPHGQYFSVYLDEDGNEKPTTAFRNLLLILIGVCPPPKRPPEDEPTYPPSSYVARSKVSSVP